MNGQLSVQGMIDNGGLGVAAEANEFNDCTFSTRASDSVVSITSWLTPPQIYLSGPFARYNRCIFNIDQWALHPPETHTNATGHFTDCVINGHGSGYPLWGHYYGINDLNYDPAGGYGTVSLANIDKHGVFRVNGVPVR
jgi:hypothetical protein